MRDLGHAVPECADSVAARRDQKENNVFIRFLEFTSAKPYQLVAQAEAHATETHEWRDRAKFVCRARHAVPLLRNRNRGAAVAVIFVASSNVRRMR
jgi:hypothetical protein